MNAQQVADMIRRSLPAAHVEVRSDDDTHFAATLVSSAFEGLRSVARHQLIYRALGECVGREIHALSIEAYTPNEWSARGAPAAGGGGGGEREGSAGAGGERG
jgi:acid stress-induced BolA-like protein IbaG/YrbA